LRLRYIRIHSDQATDKELLTSAGIEVDFLTADIKIETFLGLIIAIVGAITHIGEFHTIDGTSMLNKV